MNTYAVVHEQTGEIILEADEKQLQCAHKLLEAAKRLQAVSDRANSRDRAIRYGNAYRHPAGVAKRGRRPYQQTTRQAATHLLAWTVALVIVATTTIWLKFGS